MMTNGKHIDNRCIDRRIIKIHFLHIVIFMFKFKHSLLPAPCMHYCKLNSSSYGLRKINYFFIPPCRTKIREQSISIAGPRLWGSLPIYLQNSNNLMMSFKRNAYIFLVVVLVCLDFSCMFAWSCC